MSGLKLYYDLMSQPSRAVFLFLKVNGIPFTEKPIAIRKGEHVTDEYTKINPFQLVPTIEDNGFLLTESIAIMKYMSNKRGLSQWYPTNFEKRAKVDEYLAWQHLNTRINAAAVFRTRIWDYYPFVQRLCSLDAPVHRHFGSRPHGSDKDSTAILRYLTARDNVAEHWYPVELQNRAKVDEYLAWQQCHVNQVTDGIYTQQVIEPRAKNIPVDKEKLRVLQGRLDRTLDNIENVFLNDQDYLAGNSLTIADLHAVCELMQPVAAKIDIFASRPKLAAWQQRVKQQLDPHFDEAHKMVFKLRDNLPDLPVDSNI